MPALISSVGTIAQMLLQAAGQGNLEDVGMLLARGANVECQDTQENSYVRKLGEKYQMDKLKLGNS